MERNGMQSTQRYRTKGTFSFHSIHLEVTVGKERGGKFLITLIGTNVKPNFNPICVPFLSCTGLHTLPLILLNLNESPTNKGTNFPKLWRKRKTKKITRKKRDFEPTREDDSPWRSRGNSCCKPTKKDSLKLSKKLKFLSFKSNLRTSIVEQIFCKTIQ
uniref:Uncharacterized protein n=1 Tax=Romanomermis culicivorax TaxID=13658 RepID=A0A915JB93_ROMCU